ncbi:hypothetical protein E4T50_16862 [Aureobasidium sp. EXF-12298]|nr:hypothetical protein E4T50_16862 [Aureobasidium sp. EXF-12298]
MAVFNENSAEETKEYVKGLARLILRHAPVLEELSVGRDDLSNAVAEAYKQESVRNRYLDGSDMYEA